MDMDFLCSDYYNLFDSLDEWSQIENKYDLKDNNDAPDLIKFGEILYNQNSTSFIYICELCHKSLQNINTFCEHIKNVHDFHTSNEVEIPKVESNFQDKEKEETVNVDLSNFIKDNENINDQLKDETNYVVIPVSAIKFEENIKSSNSNILCGSTGDSSVKRARSPSIMRKINKDSRPIDFISNPWHCECGRIVPITHKYQHMKSHNDVPIYECQITGCFDIFFRQSELDEHYELIHNSGDPKKPFSCQFCQRYFSNKKNYSTHVKRIHLNDPRHHTCPYCHYYFYSKSYLQQHIYKKHNDILPEKDDETCISESNDVLLENENNFPSEEFYSDIDEVNCNNDFLCKFCNTSLSSNDDLLNHMEKLHNIKEISLCRNCGYDINSILHKNNCLRQNNVIEFAEKDVDDKFSLITFNADQSSGLENNITEDIPDDEMDFLKFLNVDFDR